MNSNNTGIHGLAEAFKNCSRWLDDQLTHRMGAKGREIVFLFILWILVYVKLFIQIIRFVVEFGAKVLGSWFDSVGKATETRNAESAQQQEQQ